ncbi:hypothetical protein KSP40_PGU014007 [Platanthera guangdongensis]|uniref:Uncharacterized protein n=1 Tax=Platanthera guangdongensis TaxID=2320717 RepID=A0ABR2MIB4_9ASPA
MPVAAPYTNRCSGRTAKEPSGKGRRLRRTDKACDQQTETEGDGGERRSLARCLGRRSFERGELQTKESSWME